MDLEMTDEDVVVDVQYPVGAYVSCDGCVVLEQDPGRNEPYGGEIVLLPESARRVARALLRLADDAQTLRSPQPHQQDRTAAERQRRHRARKRQAQLQSAVTASVTETVTPSGAEPSPPSVPPPAAE